MSMSSPGARSVSGRTRKPLRWLPWVVLLLLAVTIAVIVVVVTNLDDDDAAPVALPAAVVDAPPALSA